MKFRPNYEAIPFEQTGFQTTLSDALAKINQHDLHGLMRECEHQRWYYRNAISKIDDILANFAKSNYADYGNETIEAAKQLVATHGTYRTLQHAIEAKQPLSVLRYLHRVMGLNDYEFQTFLAAVKIDPNNLALFQFLYDVNPAIIQNIKNIKELKTSNVLSKRNFTLLHWLMEHGAPVIELITNYLHAPYNSDYYTNGERTVSTKENKMLDFIDYFEHYPHELMTEVLLKEAAKNYLHPQCPNTAKEKYQSLLKKSYVRFYFSHPELAARIYTSLTTIDKANAVKLVVATMKLFQLFAQARHFCLKVIADAREEMSDAARVELAAMLLENQFDIKEKSDPLEFAQHSRAIKALYYLQDCKNPGKEALLLQAYKELSPQHTATPSADTLPLQVKKQYLSYLKFKKKQSTAELLSMNAVEPAAPEKVTVPKQAAAPVLAPAKQQPAAEAVSEITLEEAEKLCERYGLTKLKQELTTYNSFVTAYKDASIKLEKAIKQKMVELESYGTETVNEALKFSKEHGAVMRAIEAKAPTPVILYLVNILDRSPCETYAYSLLEIMYEQRREITLFQTVFDAESKSTQEEMTNRLANTTLFEDENHPYVEWLIKNKVNIKELFALRYSYSVKRPLSHAKADYDDEFFRLYLRYASRYPESFINSHLNYSRENGFLDAIYLNTKNETLRGNYIGLLLTALEQSENKDKERHEAIKAKLLGTYHKEGIHAVAFSYVAHNRVTDATSLCLKLMEGHEGSTHPQKNIAKMVLAEIILLRNITQLDANDPKTTYPNQSAILAYYYLEGCTHPDVNHLLNKCHALLSPTGTGDTWTTEAKQQLELYKLKKESPNDAIVTAYVQQQTASLASLGFFASAEKTDEEPDRRCEDNPVYSP